MFITQEQKNSTLKTPNISNIFHFFIAVLIQKLEKRDSWIGNQIGNPALNVKLTTNIGPDIN